MAQSAFCAGGLPFEPRHPTSVKHMWNATGCHTGHHEVVGYRTKGESSPQR